ncbi:MAG: hypothetical protein JWL63_1288 [Rhodocyclales bacterium]|nr:hypothetical protein [Rhodocyclales bacterium]
MTVPAPDNAWAFDSTAAPGFTPMTPYAGANNLTAGSTSATNLGVFSLTANKAGTANAAIRITPGTGGGNDYYRITPFGSVPATLATPAAITVEAMIQFSTVTATGNMVIVKHLNAGNTQGYSLYLKPDGVTVGFRVNNSAVYEQVATISTSGGWSHIVATYDGTSMHLYVNGVEVGSGSGTVTTPGAILDSATDFQVGGNSTSASTAAVNGAIDDVRIYDVALTPAQVSARYATY